MSLAADTTSVVAQGTQAAMPKDTRPPALRLRAYRANVFRLGAARASQCEQAWWDLDHAPVLFRVQVPAQEAEETKTDEHLPSAPPGRVAIVRARLQARGPSSLRREVRPIEDTPAAVAHHHHQGRRPDALLAGASRAPRAPGQPKGGLYGARRAPTTASPRAQTAPMRAPTTQARRAHISKEDVALLAMDIDEEPSHTARPTGRALAERLYRKSDTMRSDVEVKTAGSQELTSPAPNDGQMLPMRKRGRDEADDAAEVAPYAKRLARL